MRSAICLLAALSGLASQATADVPECVPKRAVLSIAPIAPLDALPEGFVPDGYVEVAFTITPAGKPRDLVVLSSQSNWSEANARALKVLASARFEPSSSPCAQTMKIRFEPKR